MINDIPISPNELRPNMKTGIAWWILAELCSRHSHQMPLRVYEHHPCGGFYDCLVLKTSRDEKILCEFNIQTGSLHLHCSASVDTGRPTLPWLLGNNYVLGWLQHGPAVITQLEGTLGLELTKQPIEAGIIETSSTMLAIAHLCAANMFADCVIDARCGFFEKIYSWAGDHPERRGTLDEHSDNEHRAANIWRLMRLAAYDRWGPLLEAPTSDVSCVLINFSSGTIYHPRSGEALFFRGSRDPVSAAAWMNERLTVE